MPFCTSCGKEAPPGKKFCEYCGEPLETAVTPPSPAVPAPQPVPSVPPQTVPKTPAKGSGKTGLIAGIIIVLVVIAAIVFFGLPLIGGIPGSGPARQVTTVPATALPTVTAAMPVQTTGLPPAAPAPSAVQTYEQKYTETYTLVYEADRAFAGGQKVIFSQDLTNPPLYVKFNITPKMFYEERPVEIGLASEHIANISYVSQDAWFKVKVYDADNGDLKEEQGFNKEHGTMTKQEFMVRSPGNYRVEMSGNDVTAEVQILTGKM